MLNLPAEIVLRIFLYVLPPSPDPKVKKAHDQATEFPVKPHHANGLGHPHCRLHWINDGWPFLDTEAILARCFCYCSGCHQELVPTTTRSSQQTATRSMRVKHYHNEFSNIEPIQAKTFLRASSVCRAWQAAAYLHPIWTDISYWIQLYHSLQTKSYRNPQESAIIPLFRQHPRRTLDRFLDCFSQDAHKSLSIRHIHIQQKQGVLASSLCSLLERLSAPYDILSLSLYLPWECVGDAVLFDTIATLLTRLERLALYGHPSQDAMTAFSGQDLNRLGKIIKSSLTHFAIAGYGYRSFKHKHLVQFLQKQPFISNLRLKNVRKGVDLSEISLVLKQLDHLTLDFRQDDSDFLKGTLGLLSLTRLKTLVIWTDQVLSQGFIDTLFSTLIRPSSPPSLLMKDTTIYVFGSKVSTEFHQVYGRFIECAVMLESYSHFG